MHTILDKKIIAPGICMIEIKAPDIASSAGAGQFLILHIDEKGERFPLTLYDWDREIGSVKVVCQAIGVSTKKFCALDKGDCVRDVAGPLGTATDTGPFGRVAVVAGGVGIAEAFPVAKAMKKNGNSVISVIGARNADLVICRQDMARVSDSLHVSTDDGSLGRKGFVTGILKDLINEQKPDLVFAVGPVMMMKKVSEVTASTGVETIVSLNSIMIDGTGMCGGCRVRINGESRFACVDGPEFNAHAVDFEDLLNRQSRYADKEQNALDRYHEKCRIGLDDQGENR